ncbi:YitT family protein [Levilactobacillus tujiorum]|uniref:YitT family protein n=1 Tax=Levilactobacillus tujiorum TaxID=2912243 RepID=A0ABX1L6K1_9LACO|nr:YitT family protein [Levilactobacillus tujiorum]MCH5463574.1 YitT family protein [Levilactobacillus tujiorum]NLR12150.1 YitT family protein [Lactobacillus sp. HBUAS51387]NLR30706.1 YitT family protein [Levilactobacillus tujiorum]NLR32217.1 YitT family protein [Levilactobacillus tujiorum]
MDDVQQLLKRHTYTAKFSVAFFYGVLVSIAVNFFWTPGHIYSSGVTGLAQLVNSLTAGLGTFHISTALGLFLINIPMFILAWKQIGKSFTVFTFICVLFASVMIRVIQPVHLTSDPIICAIFGGAVNGFGTGFALKNGISTGGLDIIGIVLRRKTGRSMGTINIAFNSLIVLSAGFVYGWPYALYSALGLFVNAKVIDMTFTRQQRMQVMVITDRPKTVIDSIQNHMRRGITIVHGAEGAYRHDEKTILFTVITRYEMDELEVAMEESDPHAFVSISDTIKVLGHFYEPKW